MKVGCAPSLFPLLQQSFEADGLFWHSRRKMNISIKDLGRKPKRKIRLLLQKRHRLRQDVLLQW